MKIVIIILFSLISLSIVAQSPDLQSGIAPEIAFSVKITDKVQALSKIESKHFLYSNSENEGWYYLHNGTDVQVFLSYKINPFWQFSGGYQLGFENDKNYNHTNIIQLAAVQKMPAYRLSHRMRMDQTWYNDNQIRNRYRYRFSIELPLQGQSLERNEYYLVVSDEPILIARKDETDIENRLNILLGYLVSDFMKIQIGLDYRTDKYLSEGFRHRLWFKAGGYISLR